MDCNDCGPGPESKNTNFVWAKSLRIVVRSQLQCSAMRADGLLSPSDGLLSTGFKSCSMAITQPRRTCQRTYMVCQYEGVLPGVRKK